MATVLLVVAWPAYAQRNPNAPYPSGPVRIIVGFPPGGGVDVIARMVGQKLSAIWAQPLVVENRPGAASLIGTRLAAAATADGHSILINSNTMVVNQILNKNAGYDIKKQFVPVINLAWQPNIVAASNALPEVPTVAESSFPGYEVNVFSAFFVPQGTPAAAIQRSRATVLQVLAMPEISEQLLTLDFEQSDSTNEDFRRLVADEIRKWTKVLGATGVKLDG